MQKIFLHDQDNFFWDLDVYFTVMRMGYVEWLFNKYIQGAIKGALLLQNVYFLIVVYVYLYKLEVVSNEYKQASNNQTSIITL